MLYGTLAEEASALEAVIAERYPAMTADDRACFCSAVLYKVADLYRRSSGSVVLESYDANGQPHGSRPLVIEREV